MKIFRKITTIAISLVLLAAMNAPVLATGTGTVASLRKDESVYLILEPDGQVRSQSVSCWLHTDGSLKDVTDLSNLTNITNVKTDVQPRIDGTQIYWDTDAQDIYYTGTSSSTPPISAAITYTLDGAPISAADLSGKSGDLTITIRLTNHESVEKEINGQTRTVYTPFAVAMVLNLPNDTFTDISVPHGKLLTDAANQIISFVALPGLRENFDGILTDELSELMEQLPQEYTVSAHVENFSMPAILMAAATNLSDLNDIDLNDKLTTLTDGMNELRSATAQLKDGTQQLSQAMSEYDMQFASLKAGYNTFDASLTRAVAGAQQVKDGTAQLKAAAATLRQEVTGSLIPGINSSAAQQQELLTQMAALQAQLSALQLPDISALQTQLVAAVNGVCNTSFATAAQILAGTTIDHLTAAQQSAIQAAEQQIESQAASQIAQAMAGIDLSQLQQLSASLDSVDQLAGNLMSSMNQLLSALYNPSDDPSNPTTLANAIIALSIGADDLYTGAGDLNSGIAQLNSASQQIQDTLSQFQDASGSLDEGMATLDENMGKFKADGIDQTFSQQLSDDINTALAIKDEMQSQAEAYSSYSGMPQGATSSVRFIMKTADAETDAGTQQPATQQETPARTFWQKIGDFFSGIFQK